MTKADRPVKRYLEKEIMLRLGFFEALKGRNSVLLHGTGYDIAFLLIRLRQFADSEETNLAFHDFAEIAPIPPRPSLCNARQTRSLATIPSSSEKSFIWGCTDDWDATQGMLEFLITPSGTPHPRALPGLHQYFDLNLPDNQLVVTVDEYDEQWWAKFG